MLNERGIPTTIVSGAEGQYDVVDDGTLVFSKQREGRFPEDDEILAALV